MTMVNSYKMKADPRTDEEKAAADAMGAFVRSVAAFTHTSPFSGVPPTNIKLSPAEMARDEPLYLTSVAVIPCPDFYSSELDEDGQNE